MKAIKKSEVIYMLEAIVNRVNEVEKIETSKGTPKYEIFTKMLGTYEALLPTYINDLKRNNA